MHLLWNPELREGRRQFLSGSDVQGCCNNRRLHSYPGITKITFWLSGRFDVNSKWNLMFRWMEQDTSQNINVRFIQSALKQLSSY